MIKIAFDFISLIVLTAIAFFFSLSVMLLGIHFAEAGFIGLGIGAVFGGIFLMVAIGFLTAVLVGHGAWSALFKN